MIVLSWWGFEMNFFISTLISVDNSAAFAIIINICTISYQIPLGIQVAAGSLIGRYLGACKWELAKRYFHYTLVLATFSAVVIILLLIIFMK